MDYASCANHPQSLAVWRCDHCGRHYCPRCLVADSEFSAVQRCPKCGKPCRQLVPGELPLIKRSFPSMVGDAFAYPLRGRGKFIIAAFVAFVMIISLLQYLPSPPGVFAIVKHGLGMVVGVILLGWLLAYSFEVIGTSAKGRREPPEGPELRTHEDFVRPLLLAVGVVACCLLPYLMYRLLFVRYFGSIRALGLGTLAFGVLYLPMALTAAVLWNSAAGLNPLLIVASIFKAGLGYLLAPLIVSLLCGGLWLAASYLNVPVPLVGPVLEALLYCAGLLYCIMAVMRVCGLLYYAYEQRLGWFPE